MEKEIAKKVVEILEVHNSANSYEWRIECEVFPFMSNEDDYFISVYPDTPSMYSTEIKDLICIANTYRLSFWLSIDEDPKDEYRNKVTFHCS